MKQKYKPVLDFAGDEDGRSVDCDERSVFFAPICEISKNRKTQSIRWMRMYETRIQMETMQPKQYEV